MQDVVNVDLEIPDLSIKINLNLNQDDLVWDIKQNILNSIAMDLKDALNHDFYQPPTPYKAAKYLDAERVLREYHLEEGTFLQMISKKRIYKVLKVDRRKLNEVNSKNSRKKLMSLVATNQVKKTIKLLDRGIDANFVDVDKGECAMTISSTLADPGEMLCALVERGSHLDYRNKESWTALHKAAHVENYKAVKTLLSLGASPNYKDQNGFTPLYLSILSNSKIHVAEALLKDYAFLGCVDERGHSEIHQACILGKVGHLELLVSYGADVDSSDLHSNTPLHLAVKHKQLECVRMLLFRGADKNLTNLLNQTPLHLSTFINLPHFETLISQHSNNDAVLSRETPNFNDKSRGTLRRKGNMLSNNLRKLSLSTPYLHQSVTNLHSITASPDVTQSVMSFEIEGNSTGSADQQFEFDLNNDSRPSSWTKASTIKSTTTTPLSHHSIPFSQNNTPFSQNNTPFSQNNTPFSQNNTAFSQTNTPLSQNTTPTTSLRDLHTPLKTHNRSELLNAITNKDILKPAYNRTNSNNSLTNMRTTTPNNNNTFKERLSRLDGRRSCEDLICEEDEYLNSDQVHTLIKSRRTSLDTSKLLQKTRYSVMEGPKQQNKFSAPNNNNHNNNNHNNNQNNYNNNNNNHNSSNYNSSKRFSLTKPIMPLPPTTKTSDTYLNGTEVDDVLNSLQSHPANKYSKPPRKQPQNHLFENPSKINPKPHFKKPPSNPKSPIFNSIPPPPFFPKNFTKLNSPPPHHSNLPKNTPIIPPLPPTYPISPPLPPPPSHINSNFEFPFPPPPPPMF